jgi:electron transfer flavoprotein alpha subunit
MNSSGKVIAVNIDAKAPIFDYADIAIVDDWKVIAQGMIDAL